MTRRVLVTLATALLLPAVVAAGPRTRKAGSGAVVDAPSSAFPEQPSAVVVTGSARFTIVTATLLRLEYDETQHFVDAPSWFATERTAGERHYLLERRPDGSLDLDTGRLRLSWRPDGQSFNASNLRVEIGEGRRSVLWRPGDEPRANLGGTVAGLDAIGGPIDLGEGLLARDGWALVDDSTTALRSGAWYAERRADHGVDWYLFAYGDDYRAALQGLAAIAGKVPLPRRYALGSWYSRWASYSSDDFRAVLAEYASHGFPLDVLVMDMAWHRDGWGGWSWNRTLLPDAEALLAEVHARGIAVTLNLHPDGVTPSEDRYPDFMRALGLDPASQQVVRFDAGSRPYLDALYDTVQVPLIRDGVDFWWLDWASAPGTPSVPSLHNDEALNAYYFERTGNQGLRGASFARWAGLGDHRHPVHFSGDAFSTLETLAFEIPFTATAGNVGCFFWSHDIGGFRGPFDLPGYDEIYARWVQFGALSPVLRIHSSLDKRPWLFAPWASESMRRAFELRARLFPYLYTAAWESTEATWPLVRPLYLDDPGEESAYHNATEYRLGDDLLVAPVVSRGVGPGRVAARPVWFPPGTWYDLQTSDRQVGGGERLVSADIDEIPVYARGGVAIPMQEPSAHVASPLEHLVVRAWPGADGALVRSSLYEDDGVTRAHEQGARAVTTLTYARSGLAHTLTIGATAGSYAGQAAERRASVELAAIEEPLGVTVDGALAAFSYDPGTLTVRVDLGSRPIRVPVAVRIAAAEADPGWAGGAHARTLARRLEGVLGEPGADWGEAVARPGLADSVRNAVLALEGYGIVLKNEALYLRGGPERLYVHAQAPVPIEVYTFRRSSFRPGEEERFPVLGPVLPAALPLGLDCALPDDVPTPPVGALGERRTRGVAARFAGIAEPATWSLASPYTPVRTWHVSGPYPADPFLAADASAFLPPVIAGAAPADARASRPRWRTLATDADGILDLSVLSTEWRKAAYAFVRLTADRDQDATLALSSDDGATLWLDDVELFREPRNRRFAEPDLIPVRLLAGEHVLLVRVFNDQGLWQLRVGVESAAPLTTDLP